jgi:lysophospholipase L1-like esterase
MEAKTNQAEQQKQPSSLAKRILRPVLGILLGLLMIEASLWILHFAVGNKDRGPGEAITGAVEILCIGDSHTYGWNVDAPATWPARLGELTGAKIANRAAPGKNTATLIEELDEYLALDQPRLVLILAGLNNPWSRPHETEQAAPANPVSWSRTLRLVKILSSRFGGDTDAPSTQSVSRIHEGEVGGSQPGAPEAGTFDEVELDGDLTEVRIVTREGDLESFVIGGGTISTSESQLAYDWITRDLVTLAASVRAAGAIPVLLTYALEEGEYLPTVNFTIREAAVLGEVALIDVARRLGPLVEEFGRERIFFPDAHPRREGYELVARAIHDGLVDLELIEGDPISDPGIFLRGQDAPEPQLTRSGGPTGPGDVTIELSYEPGLEFNLLLSSEPKTAAPSDWFGVQVALGRGALFEASERHGELTGSFDDAGQARVVLTRKLLGELGATGAELWGCLAVRTRDWTVLGVSRPVLLDRIGDI